ncbi:MAG TPA: OmpH family outer membrane protein [Candidatus Hydrogenedentes bacterium]|nr:OmpH family outer membrane protein [Candidatus Hydrogenedentota bacterium]HIJ73873.1 OmpH family outer membrane protein [Candidatus Hydrogenedentota bacterium]
MKSTAKLIVAGVLLLSFGLLVGTTVPTSAQTANASGAYKIGIVDLQKTLDNYAMREEEVKKLEAEFKPREDDLAVMAEEWETKKKAYEDEKEDLTDRQREERQDELAKAYLDLQDETRRLEADFERSKRRLKTRLLKDLVKAIEQVGAEGDYHLVLEADPESRTGVMYYSPTMNITQRVIDRLNEGG